LACRFGRRCRLNRFGKRAGEQSAVLWFAPTPAFGDIWLTWWLGDSLGVLVFTPPPLISHEENTLVSVRRKLTIAIPMLVIFLCMASLYAAGKKDVRHHLQSQLKSEASIADAFLQKIISQKKGVLHGDAGFIRASDHVNHKNFSTSRYLKKQCALSAPAKPTGLPIAKSR
jgi:integral membrane sensor domain MASE1